MRAVRIHAAAADEAAEAAAWYEIREVDEAMFVIAYAHRARRPGYWRERLQA